MKRAVEEKEHRAHMANRLRRRAVEPVQGARKEKECRARRLSRSSSPVARLVQASVARARHNQTAGGSDNQKKRHRHGRNNFS